MEGEQGEAVRADGVRIEDRYTLNRRLGSGATAEVWLADDARTGGPVALKFLTTEFAEDPEFASLLKREWRIGSRLMHANIVRVFEYHDTASGVFYGLQYVGLTDISVLTGVAPAESLRPIGLILDALRYAHGKGVVHRDIKASNILLDSRGLPYLTDFGVASDTRDQLDLAGGGSVVGSSPQQLAGSPGEPADDVYALGILIHELLTGVPPNVHEIAASLADGQTFPDELRALLSAMLDPDAERRPDAESVAARLLAAGFPAGPASMRFVGGESGSDESVQVVKTAPVRRQTYSPSPVAVNSGKSSSGVSSRILYGGLALAATLVIAIFFVLPGIMTEKSRTVVAEPVLPDQEAVPAAEQAATANEQTAATVQSSDSLTSFNENVEDTGPTSVAQLKAATDTALGDLLSQLERLRFRAIDRWGGQEYLDAVNVYAEGDQAYVDRNYRLAREKYRQTGVLLQPFFDRIDSVFAATMSAAQVAFEARDFSEAIRLFDLATSITPGDREAEAGFARAKSLQGVLTLMRQGKQFEDDLELGAAKLAFEKALELDALWTPATVALERVSAAIKQQSFEQRMTEGFDALTAADYFSARAAFNAAKMLDPASRQPADGLLQVDQEIRLADIRRLEGEVASLDAAEQWEVSIPVYEDILKIDPDLQFAQTGLAAAKSRAALHASIATLIAAPDTLSDQANIRSATGLLLQVTKTVPSGPRLQDQKNELSRLLKRAATPLPVRFVSDNLTDVAIFKVGKLGMFATQELNLRPGIYVAAGNRNGFRDVRVEFRVAPEVEMKPVVVQCEEPI